MKKWMAVLCCIFFSILFCAGIHAEGREQSMVWTVQWKGLLYTGNYSGKTEYGRPNGKGNFQGKVSDEYGLDREIDYEGKWKDGKMEGKGCLTELSSGISYEGKFTENKLNGTVKQSIIKDGEVLGYSKVKYAKDIAYGICRQYDMNDQEIGYDYTFWGMSVDEICKRAKTYDYRTLSYQADEYKNKEIKLECRIVNIYDETAEDESNKKNEEGKNIKNRILEVEDSDKNKYMLSYRLGKNKYETIYMPFFEKDDEIVVYGFYDGIGATKDARLPSINVIYGRYKKYKEPDIKKLSFQYSDYLNYPYIYEDREIHLQGVISGVYQVDEKWIYIFIDSDTYSDGKMERYICRIKSDSAMLEHMPDSGENVTLTGVLQNLKECGEINDKTIYYPLVKMITISE